MRRPRNVEHVLRFGVLAGIVLLLFTPFVVTPGTIFPFVVGKALWARTIIEIVFSLWVALALTNARYRPPRSWVLVWLAAGLAASLLAAIFGASLQRSLWSNYERMQGTIDLAHWFALAVILGSVFRSARAWQALLKLNAGAGAAMACLVLARYYEVDVPFYSAVPEFHLPRMGGPFGNPTYLSVYMLVNLVMSAGFAVSAFLAPPAAAPQAQVPATPVRPKRRRKDRGRQRRARPKGPGRPAAAGGVPRAGGVSWAGGAGWSAASALNFWGLFLAGSVGGFVGLFGSLGFLALAYAILGRGRVRRSAVTALGVLALASVGMALDTTDPDRTQRLRFDHPAAQYVASVHIQRPGVQSRLAAWQAGLEGFAARPVLGWGPENFGVVFGRFASGYGAAAEPHDQAHGKGVEVAATTGSLGLVAYLALWAWAFRVLWLSARGAAPRERALVAFVGAAMAGMLIQSQFLFDTTTGSLQSILLLCFVANLETSAIPDARRPRLPARVSARLAALPGRRAARVIVGVAAVALAAGGLLVHREIRAGADVSHLPSGLWASGTLREGIDAFEPLANTHRWILFDRLALNWPQMRAEDGAEALRILEWAGQQAERALGTEPGEWRIQHSLARMYRAAVATDPAYADAAQHFLARAQALAPNRPVFPEPLNAPQGLRVRRIVDGGVELSWVASKGAGYHAVAQSIDGGPWHQILHVYDRGRTSHVLPAAGPPADRRYRIKACRYPGDCSALVEFPPLQTIGTDEGGAATA